MMLPPMSIGEVLRLAGLRLVIMDDIPDPEFKSIGAHSGHDGSIGISTTAVEREGDDLSDILPVKHALVVQDGHQVSDHGGADDGDGLGEVGVENDGSRRRHFNSPLKSESSDKPDYQTHDDQDAHGDDGAPAGTGEVIS